MDDTFNIISLSITSAGFAAVIWQIIAARRRQSQDLQPRVFVRLRRIKTEHGPLLAISFNNGGLTPAINVKADFSGVQKWNHVTVQSYPFLPNNGGIRNLAPGVEYTYRLGKLDKNLDHWLTSQTFIPVEFEDQRGRVTTSLQILTLLDSVYLMEKK